MMVDATGAWFGRPLDLAVAGLGALAALNLLAAVWVTRRPRGRGQSTMNSSAPAGLRERWRPSASPTT